MTMIPRGLLWGLLFLAVLLAGNFGAILLLNGGHPTCILDDASIHLGMAENIFRGHYGVNLGETSAPCSSILWPFLLAPFQAGAWGEFTPLFLNAIFAGLTVIAIHAILKRVLTPVSGIDGSDAMVAPTALLLALFVTTARLADVAFMGMEHLLQAWLTAAAALGLGMTARGEGMPRWLPAVLVLGPLVRYENLAVTIPATAFLMLRGRALTGVGVLAAIGVLLGGFSLWLVSQGLAPLPASVMAKGGFGAGGLGAGGFLASRVAGLLAEPPAPALIAALVLPAVRLVFPGSGRGNRALAAVAVATVGAHLLQGRFGASGRYQLYALLFSLAISLQLYAGPIAAAAARYGRLGPRSRAAWLAAMAACTLGAWFAAGPSHIARGAGNIHAQQFQMHRFATEFLREPVAVNDLGWVSYRNDAYVLDLWGLANPEALRRRRDPASGSGWVDSLARAHGVRAAMVYDRWMEGRIPSSWTRLGTLELAMPKASVSDSVVAFYAVRAEDAPAIRALLHKFAPTLPPTARFAFAASPGTPNR